jgi:major membrane immunogen (membrane-anchored lipoprotein)
VTRSAGIVLPLCSLLLLNGCSKVLDMDKVESGIRNGLNEQLDVDAEVECPDERDAKKGDTFECSVTVDGEKRTVRVEQTNNDGNVRWELVEE